MLKNKEQILDKLVTVGNGMVEIGPKGTLIPKTALEAINWPISGASLIRKILIQVFGRETLLSHTLTGKPSPAFLDCRKPAKQPLDPSKVDDILHFGTQYTYLTAKEVRNTITTCRYE